MLQNVQVSCHDILLLITVHIYLTLISVRVVSLLIVFLLGLVRLPADDSCIPDYGLDIYAIAYDSCALFLEQVYVCLCVCPPLL